jgi:hypothetical protein
MRKLTPWTLLRRRLEPIADELHRATPWRIEPPLTVESWLRALTWSELQIGDMITEGLCKDPPYIDRLLTHALASSEADEQFQERVAQQVRHRVVFAMDLSRRLPAAYRRDHARTGDYSHDAREVLIYGWRTSSAIYWARHFGPLYCEEAA